MAAESLTRLPADILVEVFARVDGPTMASAACACAGLHRAAKEESLWKDLCHRAWPSTMATPADKLLSSMPGGFARFYADSLPLLLYEPRRRVSFVCHNGVTETCLDSIDLVSFVDLHYKEKCVLSRMVHGTPLHAPNAGSLDCPFKLDAMGAVAVGSEHLPSIIVGPKEEGGVGVLNWALEEDLTLSWVLVDVRRGCSANVSGGKPVAVQRGRPSEGDLVARFGCAVPVEPRLLSGGIAECVVSVRWLLSEAEDRLSCTGVELEVEDAEGAGVDRRRSLAVLEAALCHEARTRDGRVAAKGYRAYVKDRRVARGREREGVSGTLLYCALCGLVVFTGLCLLSSSLVYR